MAADRNTWDGQDENTSGLGARQFAVLFAVHMRESEVREQSLRGDSLSGLPGDDGEKLTMAARNLAAFRISEEDFAHLLTGKYRIDNVPGGASLYALHDDPLRAIIDSNGPRLPTPGSGVIVVFEHPSFPACLDGTYIWKINAEVVITTPEDLLPQ